MSASRSLSISAALAALCALACDGEPTIDAVEAPEDARLPTPVIDAAVDAAIDAAPPSTGTVRMLAVGDVLFGRYRPTKEYVPVPRDSEPFVYVKQLLRSGDITFGNLECAMLKEPARFYTFSILTFRANPEHAHVLADAGFDVMSLANNHARDFGWDAIGTGRRHLEAAGIAAVGGGDTADQALLPAVIEQHGIRVGFLAWTVWLQGRDVAKDSLVAHVQNRNLKSTVTEALAHWRAQDLADVYVVSLHWGMEYEPHPRSSQRRIARAIIDAGADVILGHHAHVVQDIERYKGGVIAYSLGNFLFDNRRINQRRTLVLEVVFERDGSEVSVGDVIVHPILADHKKRVPRFPHGREYRGWRRKLEKYAPDATIAAETPRPPQPEGKRKKRKRKKRKRKQRKQR